MEGHDQPRQGKPGADTCLSRILLFRLHPSRDYRYDHECDSRPQTSSRPPAPNNIDSYGFFVGILSGKLLKVSSGARVTARATRARGEVGRFNFLNIHGIQPRPSGETGRWWERGRRTINILSRVPATSNERRIWDISAVGPPHPAYTHQM